MAPYPPGIIVATEVTGSTDLSAKQKYPSEHDCITLGYKQKFPSGQGLQFYASDVLPNAVLLFRPGLQYDYIELAHH